MPIQKLKNDTIKNLDNFKTIVSNLKIMARSKPIHKYALVVGLKELRTKFGNSWNPKRASTFQIQVKFP